MPSCQVLRRCAVICGGLLLAAACDQPRATTPTPVPEPPVPVGDCVTVFDSGRGLVICDQAHLTFEGAFAFTLQPDGVTWRLDGTGINRGTRCAVHVTGITEFRPEAGSVFEIAWQLPHDQRIPAGATFTYPVCCPTVASLASGGSYRTVFRFDSAACD